MYNNLQLFTFRDTALHTVEADGEPWFVVKDICDVLGIKQAADVARKALRGSELRKEFIPVAFSHRGDMREGKRMMLLTNESGLYTLIMRSNKPEAIEFRYWVTNTVLPSIRKTGKYEMPETESEGQERVSVVECPHSITLSAGTTKLTLAVSYSSKGSILSGQVRDLYELADRFISNALEAVSVD